MSSAGARVLSGAWAAAKVPLPKPRPIARNERVSAFVRWSRWPGESRLGSKASLRVAQRSRVVAECFRELGAQRPKNILDFGGGVGLLAIPLARAGSCVVEKETPAADPFSVSAITPETVSGRAAGVIGTGGPGRRPARAGI